MNKPWLSNAKLSSSFITANMAEVAKLKILTQLKKGGKCLISNVRKLSYWLA